MRKIVADRQIWVCSVIGAIAHNIGQIAVAIITNAFSLIVYLPILLISEMIAGFYAQMVKWQRKTEIEQLRMLLLKFEKKNGIIIPVRIVSPFAHSIRIPNNRHAYS